MRRDVLDDAKLSENERAVLRRSARILETRVKSQSVVLNSPSLVREWLTLKFCGLEREVFGVIFLDAQNRFIDFDVLIYGNADASFRVSAGSGQSGPGPQCRRSHVRSQPSVRLR